MKRILFGAAALAVAGPLAAQSLTVDWAFRYSLTGGACSQSNAGSYDATNNLVIVASYNSANAAVNTLYFFNGNTGAAHTTPFVDYTSDAGFTSGAFSPFSVASLGGRYFVYQDTGSLGAGSIQILDGPTDNTSVLATTANTSQLGRNLDAIGSGTDTFIAIVGTGDTGSSRVGLLKANEAGATTFTAAGDVANTDDLGAQGTGRAGVGMAGAPSTNGNGPDWIAAADTIGITGGRISVLKRTGALADANLGYTTVARLAAVTSDVVVDPGGGPDLPVVIALQVTTDTANNSSEVAMYQINEIGNSLVELVRTPIPKSLGLGTTSMDNRGSIEIDRTNKKVYAVYRPGTPDSDVVIARLSYSNSTGSGTQDWEIFD